MSESMRETANAIATIWPILSKDSLGTITYGAPYTVNCTYNQGSSRQYSDSSGTMFIPNTVFWYEYNGIYPRLNDKIARGNYINIADPVGVQDVEVIKSRVRTGEMDEIDDIMVLT